MNDATKLTRLRLDALPLPMPSDEVDKDARGIVLVVGGSDMVPGAMILAGEGALRAGAGKLQMATVRKAAIPLGLAVPEAMVVALPTSKTGDIAGAGTGARLQPLVASAAAVLIGPGMTDDRHTARLMEYLVPHFGANAVLVLDSAGAVALRHDEALVRALEGRVVITPHAGEMAAIMDVNKADVEARAAETARDCAARFGAVVALKGHETHIAEPNGHMLHYREGKPGLATSGSGDALAGVVAGLAARGASALTAAAWGVWAHGAAGNTLAKRVGRVGFLARELLAEIPPLLDR